MRRFSCLMGLVVVLGAVNASGAAASGWSLQRTPNPPDVLGAGLVGVSCIAKNFCIAVGSYSRGSTTRTLAERWDGTKWSLQRTPNTRGTLLGVSCTAKNFCIAVGNGPLLTRAERWDGTKWSLQRTPNPAGAKNAYLEGVSCTGKNACEAVGTENYSSVPVAERWDGTRWSLQRAPYRPGPSGSTSNSSLGGVSCIAKNACVAAGVDGFVNPTSGADGMQTLGERWNGTKWSLQQTANPVTNFHDADLNGDNELAGVSCTAMNACIAVGLYETTTCYPSICQAYHTLAERWDGTRWSLQQAPGTGMSDVSCTTKNSCTAVGYYRDALRWNGTKWSPQRTATPTGANAGSLMGVSCPAKNACIAVGTHQQGSPYRTRTLAERWSG